MVRGEYKLFVKDSRSYLGTASNSDHRLVMAKLNITWKWKTPKKEIRQKINIEELKDAEISREYQNHIKNQ